MSRLVVTGLRPSSSPAAVDRRRRIVAAARELMRELPPAEITAADVARAAAVSPATVYNLVGPRDALIVAVLEESVGAVLAKVAPVDPSRPVAAITDLIEQIVAELAADPVANRRAIAAMGTAGANAWLDTSLGDLIATRLAGCPGALHQRSSPSHTARMMHLGLRGVLVSWSYGHVADDELGSIATEIVLRLMSTAASDHVATELRDRFFDA